MVSIHYLPFLCWDPAAIWTKLVLLVASVGREKIVYKLPDLLVLVQLSDNTLFRGPGGYWRATR